MWRNAEVDHRVPLFRVWSEHRDTPWPGLLNFCPTFRSLTAKSTLRIARRKRGTRALPAPLPKHTWDGPSTDHRDGFTSVPRFAATDAVEALLYRGEAFVN